MTVEVSDPRPRGGNHDYVLTMPEWSPTPRWRAGERLEQLFERRCDELVSEGHSTDLAVDGPGGSLTYAELDARANRLARWLRKTHAVGAGDRIGLLLEQPVHTYVAMLAVLKAGAAYVPIDSGAPPDRIDYVTGDSGVKLVLVDAASSGGSAPTVCLADPAIAGEVGAESDLRLESEATEDALCYVIYTSGTTGRPKGVAVRHSSICNFVRVADEVYGVTATDRMYQGLTPAFDFWVEEAWVAWMAGATLVPRPAGAALIGAELHQFLSEQRVTALCCVPTLLATLERDLPDLRFLLVSGETCPQDLVARWHRRGRRFLNTYGPTEATVTASWAVLDPAQPVTIGVPLPTYSVVVLDPAADRVLPFGELGELGIAGIGLADGYLNLPELTGRKFVADFVGIDDNPSGRIYRTGDLALINDRGEIEHHGRIDTQVKIRGYRIELAEIEAVLRLVPGVAAAAVGTYERAGAGTELVGFYVEHPGGATVDRGAAYALLGEHLPAYMVPAYLERLDHLPVLASGKLDRNALPAPTDRRGLDSREAHVAPEDELESAIADELAVALGGERVSVESDFFDQLGANSLVLARFVARMRDATTAIGASPVSMKDVYAHRTVRALAAALRRRPAAEPTIADPLQPEPVGTPRFGLCAALQLMTFLGYIALTSVALDAGSSWLTSAHGALEVYGRAVGLGAGVLLCTGTVPIIAKWMLIGRFRPMRIRAWSLAYLRFWVVKTLIVSNPVAHLVVGSPLYSLYLRALGAKIGPRALILTHRFPVATDLIEVGADAVIRKESFFNGYRARDGNIEIGAVRIGERAFVGERTVLDIDTSIGDRAEIAHASSLQAGQSIPDGGVWHGSPAEPAPPGHHYQTVPTPERPSRRGLRYGAGRAFAVIAIAGPLEAGIFDLLLTHPRQFGQLTAAAAPLIALAVLAAVLLASAALSIGVPRLLTRFLKPGRRYPLYGRHYAIERMIAATSRNSLMTTLFGDSCAIPHYLRALGWRMPGFEQTGSNFGLDVTQDVPALSEIGSGTIVSDGLSMMNGEYSSGAFQLRPVSIGRRNYLGNVISYPADGRTGDDCLLATKVLVPTHGPLRQGVGLLGSPAFEIPRSVERDRVAAQFTDPGERARRLRAKTRHNAVTMALYLLVWYVLILGIVWLAVSPLGDIGLTQFDGTVLTAVLEICFALGLFVFAEHAASRFRKLESRQCSIYDPAFWHHERYWKVAPTGYTRIFDGTPLKPLLWRLQGVEIGRRVLDDGLVIVERTLVQIGDECTFNMGAVLQSHSLEDGVFKSDRITVGERCTVGTGALVNYGAAIGDGAVIEADAFVMKGSVVRSRARWRGNPAMEVSRDAPVAAVGGPSHACDLEVEHA